MFRVEVQLEGDQSKAFRQILYIPQMSDVN